MRNDPCELRQLHSRVPHMPREPFNVTICASYRPRHAIAPPFLSSNACARLISCPPFPLLLPFALAILDHQLVGLLHAMSSLLKFLPTSRRQESSDDASSALPGDQVDVKREKSGDSDSEELPDGELNPSGLTLEEGALFV